MADSPISDLARATTIGNNDLFVLEQGGQAKALTGQTFVAKLTAMADGHGGITSIEKLSSRGVIDTYQINFADGESTLFEVTNGDSIDRITAEPSPSSSTQRAYDVIVSVFMKSNPLVALSTFTIPGGDTGATGVGQKVYIRYSATEPTQDSDMTNIPSDWMGIAVTASNTAPSHYTDYSWNYVRGEQGEQGVQGMTGAFIWRSDNSPTTIGGTTYFLRDDVYGPITGPGFLDDPVYGDLLIWGGTYYTVNRVTVSASVGKIVEVINPYTIIGNGIPAGGTTGQVLKKSSNSDFAVEWGTGGGGGSDQVVWATYGTTTSAEIEAAYQAEKLVLCNMNGVVYHLCDRTTATEHYFSTLWDDEFLYLSCVSNVWGNDSTTPLTSMPTASQVGAVAVAQGVAHAGEFVVVGSDGNITTVTMTAWNGGNY